MNKILISVGLRELDLFYFFKNESLTGAISKMHRLETDEEYQARIKKELERAEKKHSMI